MKNLAPSVYIGHGAPLNAIWENQYHKDLHQHFGDIETPQAILVVSAHWEQHKPLQITSAPHPKIIYDYYGFPEEMYQLQYNPPGDPRLAKLIVDELSKKNFFTILNPNQGLDHGAWIPLRIMYPEARIPVLQLSIPVQRNSEYLMQIGETLRKFRKNGLMIMGSGNLIHNLPYVFSQMRIGKISFENWDGNLVEGWAADFDNWIKGKLDNQEYNQLLEISSRLPEFQRAAPTTEHFDPIYVTLGALNSREGIRYIHEGFEAGSISMRSFSSEE